MRRRKGNIFPPSMYSYSHPFFFFFRRGQRSGAQGWAGRWKGWSSSEVIVSLRLNRDRWFWIFPFHSTMCKYFVYIKVVLKGWVHFDHLLGSLDTNSYYDSCTVYHFIRHFGSFCCSFRFDSIKFSQIRSRVERVYTLENRLILWSSHGNYSSYRGRNEKKLEITPCPAITILSEELWIG